MSPINVVILLVLLLSLLTSSSYSFTLSSYYIKSKITRTKFITLLNSQKTNQNNNNNELNVLQQKTFPVLHRIAGVEWNGSCRYVNSDLQPLYNLKLVGGLRYDLDGTICTLSSFLTFPNGQTREVVMRGDKKMDTSNSNNDSNNISPTITLESTSPDGGPIYMVLTELSPDTILINEVEKGSGNIIMTSSISIVNEGRELVQVSHEIGDNRKDAVEGHQVWRLKQVPIEYDDFATRDTTGR